MASNLGTANLLETRLDQLSLSFTQCQDAPAQMSSGTAVLIKGKVYYGGGVPEVDDFGDTEEDDDDEFEDEERLTYNRHYVFCLELAKNRWSTLPKLPMELFGLGEVKGKLVTVGGEMEIGLGDGSDSDADSTYRASINEINVYDETSQKWKQSIPSMPTARLSPTVISLSTHLLVAGGRKEGVALNTVELLNHDTNHWSKTDSLPYACNVPMGVVCNNSVYLVGGADGAIIHNKAITAQIDKLLSHSVPVDREEGGAPREHSHQHSAWKTIASTPCHNPSAALTSDLVLVIGGVDNSAFKSIRGVFIYSPASDSWVCVGDLPSPISYPATVSLSRTEFLMVGGGDDNGDRLSTVYKVTLKS